MRLCSVVGCDRKHWTRGLCNTHHARRLRSGGAGSAAIRPREARPAQCIVDDCARTVEARGFCQMHYMRERRTGDPQGLSPVGLGNDVGYAGAHERVRRLYGRPLQHQCVGCPRPAEDWAYDHSDPDEKRDENGRPYSPDPTRYRPMCRMCHAKLDAGSGGCIVDGCPQRHRKRGFCPTHYRQFQAGEIIVVFAMPAASAAGWR